MEAKPLRLVFLGSDGIALPMLDWLAGPGSRWGGLIAVFTQPDRPTGRGQQVRPNAIKAWALARGLPLFQPETLRAPEREALAGLNPDLALVMAYGHILKDDFIATPRLGTVNFHASLLPRHRGAAPIQAAVAGGEGETGVSLMRVVRELDAGPVADLERVPIAPRDTAAEVGARLAAACPLLLARNLPRLAAGDLPFAEQDARQATFCRKLKKEDGGLDFSAPASVLAARINGLHPWPGCVTEIGGQPIKLGLADAIGADPEAGESSPAGTVLGRDDEGLRVSTGRGVLRLLRLQRPSGRMLPALDFLRGLPIPDRTVLPSRPMAAFVRAAS